MTKRFIKRAISLMLALAMVFGMVQTPMLTKEVQAAVVTTNVAENKTVTAGLNTLVTHADGDTLYTETGNNRKPGAITNGTIPTDADSDYCHFGVKNGTSEVKGSAYLQIDLAAVYDINEIKLYRYWEDSRTYGATVIALAETEAEFEAGTSTLVYNSDGQNYHGLGTMNMNDATDTTYPEESAGKTITLTETVSARYVRIYVCGKENANSLNHIIECQVFADVDENAVTPIIMGNKPADGTTTSQPFVENMAGSRNFRIPCLITLEDGTVVAAADARYDREADNGGIDIVVSRAEDKVGNNWAYTFANYMGDNGNVFDSTSSTLMDPEIVAKTVDGQETIYMLADLFPAGYALNTSNGAAQVVGDLAFNTDGKLLLSDNDRTSYGYYLDGQTIYSSDGTPVEGYTVDGWFNLKDGSGNIITNLFYKNSPYEVVPTTYLCVTKSTDGGKTWSDPLLLNNVKASGEKFYGVGPGRGLVAADGTIIFTCYTSGGTEYSSFIYSTDNGATWKRTANATTDHWSSESQLVELDNGTLRLVYRNGKNSICYVDATGNGTDGYTWGTPVSTGVSNCSSCMISAIKYSKPINGKEAILITCPTSSSGRFDGKIHVFTLDGTEQNAMTLVNSVAINSGYSTNFFAYSAMTELQNGDVAVLYEDGCLNFGGTGTGRGSGYASLTYKTYPIQTLAGANAQIGGIWAVDSEGEVVSGTVSMKPGDSATYAIQGTPTGNVTVTSSKTDVVTVTLNETAAVAEDTGLTFTVTANSDLEGYHTATVTVEDNTNSFSYDVEVVNGDTDYYKTVNLEVGETAVYIDETGYYTEQTTSANEAIAEVSLTGKENPQITMARLATSQGNFDGEYIEVSDCLYTFTSTGTEHQYSIQGTTASGATVYLNIAGGNAVLPNHSQDYNKVTLYDANTVGTMTLYDGTSELHFHKEGGYYFNRCGSHNVSDVKHQFEIYAQSESAIGGNIDGYVQITSRDDITSGQKYLIVALADDGNRYVLHPYTGNSGANFNHVAKLTDDYFDTISGVTQVTIKGIGEGRTESVVGNTTYYINVSEREAVNVTLDVGEAFTAQGTIVSQDTSQNIVTATNNLAAPYNQVSELVSGQSYLIGKSGYVVTQTAQNDSRANGLLMVNSNVNYTSGDYTAYAWKVTVVSQTDTGYTVKIQDKNGNYINFANPTGNSSTNTAVTLGSTEQVLSLVKQSDNSFTIGFTGESGYSTYLNNYGNSGTHAAGWSANGNTWNFYTGTESVTLTGATPGTTQMEIGDTLYNITVTDKINLTLNVGESYITSGAVTQQPTVEGIVSVEVGGYEKLASVNDFTEGSYLIGRPNFVMKNVETTAVAGEPEGMAPQAITEADLKGREFDRYLWTFKAVDGGYTIQDAGGRYLNLNATTAVSDSKAGQAVLSDTPQTFTVVAGNSGGIAIYNGTYYVNAFGGDDDNMAAYKDNDNGSNLALYRPENDTVTITGEKVGVTEMTVGGTEYEVTVQASVDYSLLDQQIEIAGALSLKSGYAQESMDYLKSVLAEAQALTRVTTVFTSAAEFEAAQGAADAMEEKLTAAILALVKDSRSVTMCVGQQADYIVNGELSGYDEADAAIAQITMSADNKTMTVKGLSVGIFDVMVGSTSYTVLISPEAKDFPITSGTGNSNGNVVTKLTISADNTFDFNYSGDGSVTWSTAPLTDAAGNQIAKISADGVLSFTESAVTTTLTTTVTATTADGTAYTVPVIIHPAPTEQPDKRVDLYVEEISNLEVYYAWNCGTDIIHACTGEVIYTDVVLNSNVCIDFMGAPHDGYALTFMASTNSDGHYMTVHTGDDVTLDESEKGFLNYPSGAGRAQAGLFGEANVKAMLYEGIIRKCDGVMGFTRAAKTSDSAAEDVTSSLTFQAEKLPTVEKVPYGILSADGKRAGFRLYTDGMTAGEGEFVYFELNVRTYRPLELDGDNRTTVIYNDVLLKDTELSYQDEDGVWRGASFIHDYGKDVAIAIDDIIPNPAVTVKDLTDTIVSEVWNDNEPYKDHKFYVAYKIQADDLDAELYNDAELTFNYKAKFSTGDYDEAAEANAKIEVAAFQPKHLVVDFGLPVTVEYNAWGKIAVNAQSADPQAEFEPVMLTTGEIENAAAYGRVEVAQRTNSVSGEFNGWKITYTPTTTLLTKDTVTLTATNTDETFTFNVYPASTVYYEENYITPKTDSEWTVKGTAISDEQQAGHPGYTQSLLEPAYNYGYDVVYDIVADSELATAKTADGKEKATFTFTGTGVDVYANSDKDTGIVMVMVKKVNADQTTSLKKMFTVDTVLDFGNTVTGTVLASATDLRNLPIVTLPEGSLEYGTYEVLLVHVPKKEQVTDSTTNETTTTAVETSLRLDGFRVYGTLDQTDSIPVHSLDNEALPYYLDAKDSVLAGMSVASGSSELYAEQLANNAMSQIYASSPSVKLDGMVLVGTGGTNVAYTGDALTEYLEQSAKNELYIYPGQSLVFKVAAAMKNSQLSMKALGGDATYTVTKVSTAGTTNMDPAIMKSNTEMYYKMPADIVTSTQDGTTVKTPLETTFTITNTSDSAVISVGKLKFSLYNDVAPGEMVVELGQIVAQDLVPAMMAIGYSREEDKQPSETEKPENSEKSVTELFNDVYDDWYTEYVQFVYDNELMTGSKNANEFRPNANITKAQVAQVLYNMTDVTEDGSDDVFTTLSDVYPEEWYAEAVAWAYDSEIITGDLTNKKFNPNDAVTREQLAIMMYRFAQYAEMDTSAVGDLKGLENADLTSDWAVDGVKWAVGSGLISGVGKDGVYDLDPQGTATRAQMAAILTRFCK